MSRQAKVDALVGAALTAIIIAVGGCGFFPARSRRRRLILRP